MRLLRAAGMLTIAGLGLCLLVLWQRDGVRISEARRRLERHLPALQAEIDRIGMLPLFFVAEQGDSTARKTQEFVYQDADAIVHLRKRTEPVILAHAARGVQLILHRRGRAIIVRAGGTLRVEWVSDDRFHARLTEQSEFVAAALDRIRQR